MLFNAMCQTALRSVRTGRFLALFQRGRKITFLCRYYELYMKISLSHCHPLYLTYAPTLSSFGGVHFSQKKKKIRFIPVHKITFKMYCEHWSKLHFCCVCNN